MKVVMASEKSTNRGISMSLSTRIRRQPTHCLGILILGIALCFSGPRVAAAQETDTAASAGNQEAPAARSLPERQLVSIDFNNVDINVFIKFISDLTKKNFVVDDKVRGKVTIISPGQITVAEAYQVFESVLEVYGFAAVTSGDIIKIVPSPDARTKSIKTRLEEESGEASDAVVTQIIPLRYADPEQIKRLFTPLVSRNSVILAYQPTNTLIITDVYSNIKRLLHILKSIDITGVGQQIAIIPVEYADATKLVTLLNSVFKSPAKSKTAAEKDITFVADERTNVIVVLASEVEVDNIRRLVKILDKETPKAQSHIHVYYLENAPAEDLAKVLMDLPQKGSAAQKEGKPTAPVVSDKVRITADKATNSLIIMADQEDYLTLEDIIRKIDIPRAMVYIEALIMEVSVNKDFRLGTEWLIGGQSVYQDREFIYGGGFSGGATGGDAGYSAVGSTTNPITGEAITLLPPGFSLGLFGEALEISGVTFPSIAAIIQAYKKDRDVRIISTPQILTTDNQEAKIYVGQNVPFQTTATASTTGTELYNSYEYRDVGKSLTITPQISKDRMVRLEMALEVTDLQSATDNRPTTLKRTVETTAIVKDGHTVVLGGLIDDKAGITEYRVPCLGSIPLIGTLFSSKAKANSQSNLYVFLTPRVIQNPEEATEVSTIKRNQIDELQEGLIKLYDQDSTSTSDTPPPSKAPDSDPQQPLKEGESRSEIAPAVSEPPGHDETIAAEPNSSDAATSQAATAPLEYSKAPASVSLTNESSEQAPAAGPAAAQNKVAKGFDDTKKASAEVPITKNKADTNSLGFTIQVASMRDPNQAQQMVTKLNAMNYAAYMVRIQTEGQIWYRVRIGYYNTRADAAETLKALRTHKYEPILIRL